MNGKGKIKNKYYFIFILKFLNLKNHYSINLNLKIRYSSWLKKNLTTYIKFKIKFLNIVANMNALIDWKAISFWYL